MTIQSYKIQTVKKTSRLFQASRREDGDVPLVTQEPLSGQITISIVASFRRDAKNPQASFRQIAYNAKASFRQAKICRASFRPDM